MAVAGLAVWLPLLLCALLSLASGTASGTPTDTSPPVYSTALAVTGAALGQRPGRALDGSNQTAPSGLRLGDAGDAGDVRDTGDGPRRRPREQWDMVGPALLLGGTLALLVLAAVGHLASKALLASMLSAALSAVQLSRQPGPNRQG